MTSPSFLAASLYVAIGGGTGAWLRYLASRTFPVGAFPYATACVNLVGSFAMGLLAGWLAHNGSESWRLLLGVGVLGGFTTFSAFSLDIVALAQRGSIGLAALYIGVSVAGGIAGIVAGLAIMKASA